MKMQSTERDWQDIPLSYRSDSDCLVGRFIEQKLVNAINFLEQHSFRELEWNTFTAIAVGRNLSKEQYNKMANSYIFLDNGLRVYAGYCDKYGNFAISQKTFKNPSLGQLRDWMGY
jgi:hypothetical protein